MKPLLKIVFVQPFSVSTQLNNKYSCFFTFRIFLSIVIEVSAFRDIIWLNKAVLSEERRK